jgi:ATP phosphoribosyltransferase regulatory subunit
MKHPPTISLPQGVRDILPEEAKDIGGVESAILTVFEGHGFVRVITPLLEYVDVLSLGMGTDLKEQVLKFIDPSSGRVIAIRPDITAQIARVVASRMRDYDLPLRLCYNESVLRYQGQRRGKSLEIQQIGAELISRDQSPEADAEMICMAIEAMDAAGLKGFKLDIGDVGFLRTILAGLVLEKKDRQRIKDAVAKKDTIGLEAVLDATGVVSGEQKKVLLNLTTFYGEEEVLEKAAADLGEGPTLDVLRNIERVYAIIIEKGYKAFVTFDLGEVRGFDYYTGIIFEGFARGVGKAILSGGRYDNLIKKYGYDCAATGFAFDVEAVVAALERDHKNG